MRPSNTSFLSFSMVFHFHVYGRKRNVPKTENLASKTHLKRKSKAREFPWCHPLLLLCLSPPESERLREAQEKNLTQPKDHERLNFMFSY